MTANDDPADGAGDPRDPVPGNDDEPQVYAVGRTDSGWTLERREFLAAMGAAAGAGMTGGRPVDELSAGLGLAVDGFAHRDPVTAVAVTRNAHLITGSRDHSVKFWRLPEGALVGQATRHTEGVSSLAATPDGRAFASGGADRSVKLWSLTTQEAVATLHGHTGEVRALVFSADGKTLVSAGADGTVRVWSVPLWDLEGARLVRTLEVGSPVHALAMDPAGAALFAGDDRGRVTAWELRDAKGTRRTLQAHAEPVRALAVSPRGEWLASGGLDGNARTWSLPLLREGAVLRGHGGGVGALAFTPDGALLATGSRDNAIRIWSVPQGELVHTLRGHTGDVNTLAVDPDGAWLVSGSDDKSVQVWSVQEGTPRTTLVDLEASPAAVQGIRYRVTENGREVTYTLPGGARLPEGAACICNAVPGSCTPPAPPPPPRPRRPSRPEPYQPPPSQGGVNHYWYPN